MLSGSSSALPGEHHAGRMEKQSLLKRKKTNFTGIIDLFFIDDEDNISSEYKLKPFAQMELKCKEHFLR